MYSMNVTCDHLAVHQSNRHGVGIDLSHMSELITSIAKMGYIAEAGVGQRIAVELDASADSEECRHGSRLCVASRSWAVPILWVYACKKN